jgi:uncharacterized cofD-like protein
MSQMLSPLKWLHPGMRVKRWLLLALIGLAVALLGLSLYNHAQPMDFLAWGSRFWNGLERRLNVALTQGATSGWGGMALVAAGAILIVFSIMRLAQSLTAALMPGSTPGSLVDTVYRNRLLAQGARVVVIGGGTGLSTMLRGLKQYTSNIVAVVTVTDDGGSSGRLTRQLNILPPGDIRNCLVALADSEATMTDLFQFRFRGKGTGDGLRDHAFGNLLIAAMTEISGGDFEQAVRETSRVLNIRGTVLPSTLTDVCLRGEMEDGSFVEGETNIAHSPLKIRRISLCPADVRPLEEVLEAIALADIIVMGPGSLYTSVLPNLLVSGIQEALHRAKAKKVYICNVMTQPGETDGFAASDHLKAIEAHVPRRIVDYALVNTGVPSLELLNKYRQSGAVLVEADTDRIRHMGYRALPGNYISQTDVVRHDSGLLAEAIMRLLL